MALSAQLYQDDRSTRRFRVEFDATLRDPAHQPIDVVVEDLSATGFRVVTSAALDMGVEVGLGLAGIGTQRAFVVWRGEGIYGCEFIAPLKIDDLAAALAAPSTDPVILPASPWAAPTTGSEPQWTRLSLRSRALAILAGAVAAWVLVIALAVAVTKLVAQLF